RPLIPVLVRALAPMPLLLEGSLLPLTRLTFLTLPTQSIPHLLEGLHLPLTRLRHLPPTHGTCTASQYLSGWLGAMLLFYSSSALQGQWCQLHRSIPHLRGLSSPCLRLPASFFWATSVQC